MEGFYDMHVECECGEMLDNLGFRGACAVNTNIKLSEPEIFRGRAYDIDDITRLRKIKRDVDAVFVNAKTIDVLRKAIRMASVDVVHVDTGDMLIDHIIAKSAAEHKTFIEFRFHDMLNVYGIHRAMIFRAMRFNAKMVRKYKAPFVITSGAKEKWELRSPSELIAFGVALGFQPNEAKRGLIELASLVARRKRKGYIADGIEVVYE